jgi:hypothetical protein
MGSNGLDEARHDLFAAGFIEGDFQLAAIDGNDPAIAEFLMEDAIAYLKRPLGAVNELGLESRLNDGFARLAAFRGPGLAAENRNAFAEPAP